MTKGRTVKSVIVLAVCLALAVCAFLCGYDFNAVKVRGKRNAAARITDVEQMSVMLERIVPLLTGKTAVSMQADGGDGDEDNDEEIEYESAVINEVTSLCINNADGDDYDKLTVQIKNTYAVTPEYVYLKSDYTANGTALTKKSSDDEKDEEDYIDMSVAYEMYIKPAAGNITFRLNRLVYAENGKHLMHNGSAIGKWCTFDGNGAIILTPIVNTGTSLIQLDGIKSHIATSAEDGFTRSGEAYVMKEDGFSAFSRDILTAFGQNGEHIDKDSSGSFEVDLSVAQKPAVLVSFKNDYSGDGKSKKTEEYFSIASSFVFSDINAVEANEPADGEMIEPEDLAAILEELV